MTKNHLKYDRIVKRDRPMDRQMDGPTDKAGVVAQHATKNRTF